MLIHNNYIHTGNTPREHMYTILNKIERLTNKGIEMTEEQQDEPDSPSTQPDLTTILRHDDSPYIVNEVLKELSARKLPVTDKVQSWLEHAVKENEGGSHNAEDNNTHMKDLLVNLMHIFQDRKDTESNAMLTPDAVVHSNYPDCTVQENYSSDECENEAMIGPPPERISDDRNGSKKQLESQETLTAQTNNVPNKEVEKEPHINVEQQLGGYMRPNFLKGTLSCQSLIKCLPSITILPFCTGSQ